MRTESRWANVVCRKYLSSLFPPRIQKDLSLISLPSKLPEIGSYFIYGPTESGKTLLAAFLLLEAQKGIYLEGGPKDQFDICIFVTTDQLIANIRDAFNDRERELRLINKYSRVRVLVLDDFGTIKPTDWVISILYTIINNRYENIKDTIITSNYSLPDLANLFGDDRITSRIDRMCKKIRKNIIHG